MDEHRFDKDKLLRTLGLTETDLEHYLRIRNELAETLTLEQRRLVDRLRPTASKALKAFDGKITEQELLELFRAKSKHAVIVTCLPGEGDI